MNAQTAARTTAACPTWCSGHSMCEHGIHLRDVGATSSTEGYTGVCLVQSAAGAQVALNAVDGAEMLSARLEGGQAEALGRVLSAGGHAQLGALLTAAATLLTEGEAR